MGNPVHCPPARWKEDVIVRSVMLNEWVLLKVGLVFSLLALVIVGPNVAFAQAPAAPSLGSVPERLERPLLPQFVPGQVIVKLKPVAGRTALPFEELTTFGLQSSPRRTSGGELVYEFAPSTLLRLQSLEAVREQALDIVQKLNARPDVEWSQPNWILQPVSTTPNDSRYKEQWHYFNNGSGPDESPGGINLPRAWEVGMGGASVHVAVLDTGILPHHEDIAGSPNLGAGFDMISDVFMANDGEGRDSDPTDPGDATVFSECFLGSRANPDSWHGTHVAGTIGVGNTNNAVGVAGVNWQIKVLPVRVLGKCGGTIVDINDGIRWAAGLPVPAVPQNPTPARVINMSLGAAVTCSQSPATQSAINDAVAAGTTVVVAAGNNAQDAAGFLPASCDNVITVAASDARGHLVTRYSNFGPTVEIMAPGGDRLRDDNSDGNPDGVLSIVRDGYDYYNGTSMAAPHVAGIAALLFAANPTLSPAEVLSRIQANAISRSAAQCPRPCGAGLLNAQFEQ
jgi:serine protease